MKEIAIKKYSLKTVEKKCPVCKKRFRPTKSQYQYCSVKCGARASRMRKRQRLLVKCDNCGKEFYKQKSQIEKSKHNYCSRKCYSQHKIDLMEGKKNPNWKNGISKPKSGVSGKNRHYRKGRYYERKTRKILEEKKYYTIRSAASKGIVDIVAFNRKEIIFIQVKSGTARFSKKDKVKFSNLLVPSNCRKELWIFKEHYQPIIKIIK